MVDNYDRFQSAPNVSRIRLRLRTIGLLFRFFDFKQAHVYGDGLNSEDAGLPPSIRNDAFLYLLSFTTATTHSAIRQEALIALGHFCTTNFDFLSDTKLCDAYHNILGSDQCDSDVKITVLHNILMCLRETDASEKSFAISRLFIDDILHGFLDINEYVRSNSLEVVQDLLSHLISSHWTRLADLEIIIIIIGIVPYLICLSTDVHQENANCSKRLLKIINRKYPHGFGYDACASIWMGMQYSLELETTLRNHGRAGTGIVRGYFVNENEEKPTALNDFLYTLNQNNQKDRKCFIDLIFRRFQAENSTMQEMIYLVDNLAYFPYVVREEALYVLENVNSYMDREQLYDDEDADCKNPHESFPIPIFGLFVDIYVFSTQTGDDDPDCFIVRLKNLERLKLLMGLRQHLQAMYDITDE